MSMSQKRIREPQDESDATSMATSRQPQDMQSLIYSQDDQSMYNRKIDEKRREYKQNSKQINKSKTYSKTCNQQIQEMMQEPKKKISRAPCWNENERQLFKKLLKKHGNTCKVISNEMGSKTQTQVLNHAQVLRQQILRDANHPDKELLILLERKVAFTEDDELKIIKVLSNDGQINYSNLKNELKNKTQTQLISKLNHIRQKIERNPKAYGKKITDIVNNKLKERWTEDQKSNFILALRFYGKDFKEISGSKMVENRSYDQIIHYGKDLRNKLLKKQNKTVDEDEILAILQGNNMNEWFIWSESENNKIIEVLKVYQKVDFSELKKEFPNKTMEQVRHRIMQMRRQSILNPQKFETKIIRILSERQCIPLNDKEIQILQKAIKEGKNSRQIFESQQLDGRTQNSIKEQCKKLKKQGQN